MIREKELEIIVSGKSIGIIKIKLNGCTTIVNGEGIIPSGEYFMKPREIEEMIYRKVSRDYIK